MLSSLREPPQNDYVRERPSFHRVWGHGYGRICLDHGARAATILIPGDYFAINTQLPFDKIAALGFPVDRIKDLSAMVGLNVQAGGRRRFACRRHEYDFVKIFRCRNIDMKALMPYWFTFALMFEALFHPLRRSMPAARCTFSAAGAGRPRV